MAGLERWARACEVLASWENLGPEKMVKDYQPRACLPLGLNLILCLVLGHWVSWHYCRAEVKTWPGSGLGIRGWSAVDGADAPGWCMGDPHVIPKCLWSHATSQLLILT